MAEPIRNDEPLTTSDFVSTRPNYIGNPIVASETRDREPRGPQLVENDFAMEDLRSEGTSNTPVTSRLLDEPPALEMTRPKTVGNLTDTTAPLFSDAEVTDFRSRWSSVQAGFVDEPRHSVEQADQLVATVMQRLAEGFANERASLEGQWDSGDNVSTEDLRVALQRYRAFFGRLLNAA